MGAYGDAVLHKHDDGRVEVVSADPTIGISVELLAETDQMPVDESGCILLAGDPRYRYRPVRFSSGEFNRDAGPLRVLVCERVGT